MIRVIEALTPPEGNFASPSAIVVNGLPIQNVYYNGTLVRGQIEAGAAWPDKAGVPQANPYIQITAQKVSWKRDDVHVSNSSTMRAQWSVKIKWASNDLCDLTGTVVTFAVNGRVVNNNTGTTISSGTTKPKYTLAAGTGEEALTLSCSWRDNGGGYSGHWVPYTVRSKIDAAVSNIPANAISSGSLAIAEKSSSTHSLIFGAKWPDGWFDTKSLSDVSMIQFLQNAVTADNVFIRAPKTITVDSKIVIEGARLSRGESASGTDRIGFSYTSIKLASVTWGVASNLSFDRDLRLCFKLSISNKTEDSAYITFTIPTTGTTSGTATDIVCNGHAGVSCEEYADLEGTSQDCYTDIRFEPAPTHEYTIYPSLSYMERKNAYNPIYDGALPYALCHVQTASMVLDYGYKRKDSLPDISRMPGTPGFGGFSGFGGTTLWTGPLVGTSPANIYSNIVYDKPAPPPYVTITGCILPALPDQTPDSDWNCYWSEEGWYAETGYVYSLALRVDELYPYVNSIFTRRTDASALSRIYGDIVLPTITLRLTPTWDSSLALSITDAGNMARINHDDIGNNIDSSVTYYSNYINYGLMDRETYMQVTGIENIPAANRKVSVDFIYGTDWEIPTTRYASDTRTIQGIAMASSPTTIHVGELDLADGTSTDLDQAFLDLFTAYNAQYATTASREPYTYEITYRSNR